MRVLLLRLFTDVLRASLQGKQYEYCINPSERVPEDSMRLWKDRGYEPSGIGIASVIFAGSTKEYCYPAYFWSE